MLLLGCSDGHSSDIPGVDFRWVFSSGTFELLFRRRSRTDSASDRLQPGQGLISTMRSCWQATWRMTRPSVNFAAPTAVTAVDLRLSESEAEATSPIP